MRLVDDIADQKLDVPSQPSPMRVVRNLSAPRKLWAALAVTICFVVILNREWASLSIALFALGAAIVADLGLKKSIAIRGKSSQLAYAARWAALLILYEAAPFFVFLYLYSSWALLTKISLPKSLIITTTTALWSLFEFWKYSRHFSRADWNTYGLSVSYTRWGLLLILAISVSCFINTSFLLNFSGVYFLYFAISCSLFALFVLASSSGGDPSPLERRIRDNLGLLFFSVITLGLSTALITRSF
jgi:hypothetical protein